MTGIDGKVVAITGASSGIGAATAELLASRGARVVLGARRADRLAEVVDRIVRAGGQAVAVPIDVRLRADLEQLVSVAVSNFGRLDVLVANAGVGPIAPLADLRVEEWEAMIDINVRGLLYGIAAALPGFRAQRSGHFVHTLSTSGLKIVPGQAVYAGTKNAARAISDGLRQEVGPDIRVTTVSPGFVDTDFAVAADPSVQAALVARRDEIAMAPSAVARIIAFAIEQPADVDISDVVVRPSAQA